MDTKKPRSREKNVTEGSKGVHRRGDGLGTGPVGSSNGYSSRQGSQSSGATRSGGGSRAAIGGGGGILGLILLLVLRFIFGGGLGSSIDESASSVQHSSDYTQEENYSSYNSDNSEIDESPASEGSRAKYTQIKGNGSDNVTLMVYMCGTDLESRSGMASSDLKEMAQATANSSFGENVNLIVYTGGCKKWQINGISNSSNQVYQLKDGKLKRLVENDGAKPMTSPDTLSAFIKWTASKFPANRYDLIFWDHGGGSVSGYGYDEKFQSNGSMNLAGIRKALKTAGVKFDFIGFDTCLMATAETALMLNDFADYMIASEETEPGIGWYYTNWVANLGNAPSMPTLQIGKQIVDGFVEQCSLRCAGQKTTLSVIDLAEFANNVPSPLSKFSKSISSLITNKNYKKISDARYNTREFASSSKIDQIDLIDLCNKMNTKESIALATALRGAIKYNRTSQNMTCAYGVSIYFPYQRASYVDKICNTYQEIGMDESYAQCIKDFAGMEISGQVASGGSASPLGILLGSAGSSSSSSASMELIEDLLNAFLGGRSTSISGLSGSNTNFFANKSLNTEQTASYISVNQFDSSTLHWKQEKNGNFSMQLTNKQLNLLHSIDLNMFYDDGEGYVDLGLDNVYDWDGNKLIASSDNTWLAINKQPVAYYHTDTVEYDDGSYTINGRVPAMLNGQRVNLLLVFDSEHPYGFIAGAEIDYQEKATLTSAKNIMSLQEGDKLDFLCDFYSYSGEYKDSYYLGETMTVTDSMQISNVYVGSDNVKLTYRFTDIYNQEYWSEPIE